MATASAPDDSLAKVAQAAEDGSLSRAAASNIRRWLTEAPFLPDRDRLVADIDQGRWRELDDAFFAVLEFGTGGRRGRMYPVGTNVLNERTIAESARGLADYVSAKKGSDSNRFCVIARDARRNSKEFAECCARVLAAAGFTVYLFPEMRSTPLLSFAVRYLGCDAGIMITASHNPPSDNGFKCYAGTGGQVIPPDDSGIIACVEAASSREIPQVSLEDGLRDGSIVMVGPEVDDAFIAAVVSQSVSKERDASIVYTPMHGVGETACAAALRAAGFSKVNVLASQRDPDPDFPNVPGHVANPEVPRTLEPAIEEARRTGADLVIASDPDADRIGVGLPIDGNPAGGWVTLSGNQIGALLAAFVIEEVNRSGDLRPDHYLVTTLVSTPMGRALAERAGIGCEDDLLVGFKWIGHRIDQAGPSNFLFGFEESHGYLRGTHVRDKDAAVAALLFAELVATLKARGQTVLDYLDGLYRDYGHYGESLINKVYEGRTGLEKIKALMAALREAPPREIGGLAVTRVDDYGRHESRVPGSNAPPTPLPEPSGDLLIFHLDAPGTRFAARPSGTEPKIKFYLFARTDTAGLSEEDSVDPAKLETSRRLEQMAEDIHKYIASKVADNE
jgi:phosphoglucomutase/phosphomannomutase